MKTTVLLLLFSLSISTYSQSSKDNNYWALKANVNSLIDIFSFPTVQLSIEKKFTNYFSINVEGGYQFYDFQNPDTLFLNPKGFKANIEFRIYFLKLFYPDKSNKFNGFYIGLQGFKRNNQFTSGISYYSDRDSIGRIDYLGVKKTIGGINCMVGYELPITKRLVIDAYMGLGGMNKDVKNTERQFNSDNGDSLSGTDLVPLFSSLDLSESSGRYVNFTFGLRLGIRL